MNLYLIRHTEPVPGLPANGARPLTAKGIGQAELMAKWLRQQIGRVDITITSPFERAIQTARVMADALGSHIADTRMLQPDGEPAEMSKEIARLAQQSKDVLVVGHDPSLNNFLGWAIGCTEEVNVRMEWGSVAWLKGEFDQLGLFGGSLQWLVNPKVLMRDEDEQEVIEAARAFAELALGNHL